MTRSHQSTTSSGEQVVASSLFWRVEGSLLDLSAVRPVAFFTWNAQTFTERWTRRGLLAIMAAIRPFLYAINRVFATRVLHTVLRGVSQDRLDLLGEEYFKYVLLPKLGAGGLEKLKQELAGGQRVVLVSQGLDHVMRPLAQHLGIERLTANRLEFRDGLATGRLLEPVIRPRGALARLSGHSSGKISRERLSNDLGFSTPTEVDRAIVPPKRRMETALKPVVIFDSNQKPKLLSVREALAGKNILLVGVTGFIGKVWLASLLQDLPEIGKIYLLVRRQKSTSAQRRLEKIVEESPVFDVLQERYGSHFPEFMARHIEVVEGDVSKPGLGLAAETFARLAPALDLVVNSSGLTDFNPDLRDALSTNLDAVLNVVEFIRQSDHAALMHLSTCYVAGDRDGRIAEEIVPNYTPAQVDGFDAEQEWRELHELVRKVEADAEGPEITKELQEQALHKSTAAKNLSGHALDNQIRKNRLRWLRNYFTEAGTRRAQELGWPNTYTFSKSLAESLIEKFGADLPVAVVRPSIVESSLHTPFRGWNEGINTSAGLSYLLGTYFRQLPSNKRKRLDIIPVDLVCRGMTLICAALVGRRQQRLYQLATSVTNPCDMRRSIELTCLAHRQYYRGQEGVAPWLRSRFETIPVSKDRYEKFSAPAQKAVVRAIKKVTYPLPFMRPSLARTERSLDRVQKLIELYEPFILRNEHDFEAQNIELLSSALPADEKEKFGYDARSIDWWEYWINIHIPALRRWTYPLIEGRAVEYRPRRSFHLDGGKSGATPKAPGSESLGTGATWQYS